MAYTQSVSILFSLASAAAFLAVAVVLGRRSVSAANRGANRAFAMWWGALSVTSLLGGLQTGLAVAGFLHVGTFVAISIVNLLLICVALWGLLHYLLVLIADIRRFAVPLALLYVGLAIYFCYLTLTANYTTVNLGDWTATLEPRAVYPTWYGYLLLALIIGPQFIAALAYFTLVFRVDDPAAKKRILIVSLSIIIWLGSAILVAVTQVPGAQPSEAWQWTSRLLALGAAGAIMYAYLGLAPRVGNPAPTTREEAERHTREMQMGRKLAQTSPPGAA